MAGKNVHDYKIPNNPDANEWNNLCLEDIGIYWDLPNFDECKYYYFNTVDLDAQNFDSREHTPVKSDSIDDVVNQYYGWRLGEKTHQILFVPVGVLSAISILVAGLAL